MSWFQWLGTQTGRAVLQGAALVSGLATFGVAHIPQTFYLNKYQEIVQSYEKGMPQPVPKKVQNLFQQTLTDLMCNETEKSLIKTFTVYGFDLFHAGCTGVWTGAIIGVPINFSYESVNDVNRKITVGTVPINWQSPAGEQLQESLVLSEDAKKFGLAREVASVNGSHIWMYTMYPTMAVTGTYILSRVLNDRFHLRKHPIRFITYSLIATFFFAAWAALTDITTITLEGSADKTAAGISRAHAEGGIEFYKKLQERNKALRVLMGATGEKLYTTTGNEAVFLRIKTTPLSERLQTVEKVAKSLQANAASE